MHKDPIKEIERFQKDRLLNKQPFNETVAISNILEELLELKGFNVPKENRGALSEQWLNFEETLLENKVIEYDELDRYYKEDALCDIMVFAIGELMKLGQDTKEALIETSKEINSRMQEPRQRDEWQRTGVNGKFQKWVDQPKETLYKADYSKSMHPFKDLVDSIKPFRLFERFRNWNK